MDIEFFWVYEPGENVEHIAEHDLDPEDIEHADAAATSSLTAPHTPTSQPNLLTIPPPLGSTTQ